MPNKNYGPVHDHKPLNLTAAQREIKQALETLLFHRIIDFQTASLIFERVYLK